MCVIIMFMDKEKIAYASGFFDGDGCITTGGGYTFRLTLSNTDKRVLDWFQSNFGGTINNQHLPANPNHNIAWKWIVAKRSEVLLLLETFEPYLISKKDQAQAAITFLQKYNFEVRSGRKVSEEEKSDFDATKDLLKRLKTDKHYPR